MTAIDPRLVKVINLWRETKNDGEKAAAMARGKAMAASAGLTFEQAVAAASVPSPTPTRNFFDGFDDFCEAQEPGYKARRAAEKAEKERQRLARRAAIIARYGSEEAALAPCEHELRLHKALAPWRIVQDPPWQRWTLQIDGYNGLMLAKDIPAHLREAIERAEPLPTAFATALAEYRYWIARRDEMEDVLGPNGYGDSGLDTTAEMRLELLRPLVEHELPAESLRDLRDRLRYFDDLDIIDKGTIIAALVRDADALVAAEDAHPSKPSTTAAAPHPSTPERRDGQIRAALDADPSRPDRDIARACCCSPTTVGKVRRAMGLSDAPRFVRRGQQTYQACFVFEGPTI